MADLFLSRQAIRLNDGTADGNNAVIVNAAPGAGDYGLVVRQVGVAAAAALADNTANPTVTGVGAFPHWYDGATWDRALGNSTDGLLVNLGANNDVTVSGTVDTELPTAAALADDTANPTVPTVGAAGLTFDGTNWDRRRSVIAALDSVGQGIAAAGIVGQLDDTATAAVTENQFAPVRISTRRALLIEGVASGTNINVNLAASAATVTVDTELPTAAALTDNFANPTVPGVGAFAMVWDGATWDRAPGNSAGGLFAQGPAAHDAASAGSPLLGGAYASAAAPADVTADGDAVRLWALRNGAQVVNLASGGTLWTNMGQTGATGQFVRIHDGTTMATVRDLAAGDALNVAIVDGSGAQITSFGGGTQYAGDAAATATPTGTIAMGLANAAAPADVSANNDAVAQWMLRNGSAVMNLASGGTLITAGQKAMTASLPVVIASDQSAITVDSELSTAAAAADAFANPTAGGVLGFLMGYNGTNWDRVRTANTGRLQVDVITGGGSPPASEVPTSYNSLVVYGTTSGTASGATASVVTNTPANTKLTYVRSAMVSASGATKWQVKFGAAVHATGFISSSKLGELVRFDPPIALTGDGATALTIDVTNRESSAMDLYARLGAIVQA